jgi:methionyl-tRNA formyltransferase
VAKIKIFCSKEYALANNLRLLQPTNLKEESFLAELKSLNANLQIVVAFRMPPKVVWEMPEAPLTTRTSNYRGLRQ